MSNNPLEEHYQLPSDSEDSKSKSVPVTEPEVSKKEEYAPKNCFGTEKNSRKYPARSRLRLNTHLLQLNGADPLVEKLAEHCSDYQLPRRRKLLLLFPLLAGIGAVAGFIFVLFLLRDGVGWEYTYKVMALAGVSFVLVSGTFILLNRQLPPWLVALSLLWGAGISPVFALFFNELGANFLAAQDFGVSSFSALSNTAFIVAPLVEEAIKGLGVALILWGWRKYLLSPMAGVVCAGLIAAGFAYTENLLYLSRGDIVAVFIVRGILTPYAHSLFTTATGLAIGYALTRVHRGRILISLCGWGIAVCLHAIWNSVTGLGALTFLGIMLFWWTPYFISWFTLLLVMSFKHNKKIALGIHPFYRAGWLSSAQAGMIYSRARYRSYRKQVKANFSSFLKQLRTSQANISYAEVKEMYRRYRQYLKLLAKWRRAGRKLALSYLRLDQSGTGGEYFAYYFWQAQTQLHGYEQSFAPQVISNPIFIYPIPEVNGTVRNFSVDRTRSLAQQWGLVETEQVFPLKENPDYSQTQV